MGDVQKTQQTLSQFCLAEYCPGGAGELGASKKSGGASLPPDSRGRLSSQRNAARGLFFSTLAMEKTLGRVGGTGH